MRLHIQRMTWEGNLKKQKQLNKNSKSACYWGLIQRFPYLCFSEMCIILVARFVYIILYLPYLK